MTKKDQFFYLLSQQGLAVTYADVRLRTGYSEYPPSDVSIESKFTRNVPLKVPIASAAMDTVTEARMAIAMGVLGGIGVIHRNFTPKEQASQVKRVKHFMNGRIERPITVQANQTIENILNEREARGWSFHSFPVLGEEQRVVGILTGRDFNFCRNHSQKASEVMTKDVIMAPAGTSLDEAYEILTREKKNILPLVDHQGTIAGMYVFSDLDRIKRGGVSNPNIDKDGRLYTAADVGVGEGALERISLMAEYLDVPCVSTAHADSHGVIETVKAIKKQYSLDVYAGNISEGSSTTRLLLAGVDGIGVGQGPGSICTTRVVAGIGCPQVTAVYYAAKAIEGHGIPVCADGGIEYGGDIPVAIGAGAHSVMIGGLLAATTESPGEVIQHNGRPYKPYRGMGSRAALEASRAARERYRQGEVPTAKLVPEGVEGIVPFQGDLKDVLHQLTGCLRSGMGYVGAANIEELRRKANFWRITGSGLRESHPHNIVVTAAAPNYHANGS